MTGYNLAHSADTPLAACRDISLGAPGNRKPTQTSYFELVCVGSQDSRSFVRPAEHVDEQIEGLPPDLSWPLPAAPVSLEALAAEVAGRHAPATGQQHRGHQRARCPPPVLQHWQSPSVPRCGVVPRGAPLSPRPPPPRLGALAIRPARAGARTVGADSHWPASSKRRSHQQAPNANTRAYPYQPDNPPTSLSVHPVLEPPLQVLGTKRLPNPHPTPYIAMGGRLETAPGRSPATIDVAAPSNARPRTMSGTSWAARSTTAAPTLAVAHGFPCWRD